jgi:hypothetical protein
LIHSEFLNIYLKIILGKKAQDEGLLDAVKIFLQPLMI